MEYGIINYEENNKKFTADQNSSLNKRDDDTIKLKWIAPSGSFTLESLRSTLECSTLKYCVVTLFVQRIWYVECTKSNVGIY